MDASFLPDYAAEEVSPFSGTCFRLGKAFVIRQGVPVVHEKTIEPVY